MLIKPEGYGECCTCKYGCKDVDEEPCLNCKNNFVVNTLDYNDHKLLWESPDVTDSNNVLHPSHYNQGDIECIDAMVSAFGKEAVENFCVINAFKYVWRSRDKNGLEDVDKAIWYLNRYKELVDSE